MIKFLANFITYTFLGLFWINDVFGQSFTHPGILHTASELDFVKSKIQANQQPWKNAYNVLSMSKYTQLNYTYKAYDTVKCGSFNKPDIGCDQMVHDGMAAYSLSLMWYFTNNKQYASKAIQIITAWSIKYKKSPLQYSNSRLVISWATPWFVNAAEILRYTNSGWSTTDNTNFINMLNKFLPYVLDETMPGNNWIQSAIEAHFSIAIFKDDKSSFNLAVNRWKQRVKTYIYETSDGSTPVPIPGKTVYQTINIWKNGYSSTAFINGVAMETCRDLGHLKLGFNSMMYAAESAWHQGVDLFSLEQKRIRDFLELHGSWMTGAKAVPSNVCDGIVKPGQSSVTGIAPPTGGGRIAWELAYNHLHDRLGINLPYTLQMINSTRPANIGDWVFKWETLTYAGRMFSPLPVNLISFSGESDNQKILLKWSTSSEVNSDHFILEKSENGIDFISIANIKAAGNSNSVEEYEYTDYSDWGKTSFFRLIEVDKDGKLNYSNIISVINSSDYFIQISPNPFGTNIIIANNLDEDVKIIITDLNGQEVRQIIINSGESNIDGTDLAKGVYFVNAFTEKKHWVIKLIKM